MEDEFVRTGDDKPILFDIPLDQDLLETIFTIYPEWFTDSLNMDDDYSIASSPRSAIDDASLQQQLHRNKESLKVKLLLRRPINQLIDQGILPREYLAKLSLDLCYFVRNGRILSVQSVARSVRVFEALRTGAHGGPT